MSLKYLRRFTLLIILLFIPTGCSTSNSGGTQEPLVGSAYGTDHDDEHITFVNQTDINIKFEVKVTGADKHKSIDHREANYQHIGDCYSNDYSKKNFEIRFKKIVDGGFDEYLMDGTNYLTAHRRCSENLYIWREGSEYKINDEPHIDADLSGCDDDDTKPAVLFAHGYNDSQKAWADFAPIAEKKGWRVFRTSVSQDGSIRKRAHMLNTYINKAASQCNIPDGTLRVVGHSMGGLDLRYLVSYYDSDSFNAAKKIERVYTIATPHQGDVLGYFASTGSDAARDLRTSHMDEFNKRNPYSDFVVEGRQIPFLAMRFYCRAVPYCDGMVGVENQTYGDAPYSMLVYDGKHMPKATCDGSFTAELEQEWLIESILDDHKKIQNDGTTYTIPNCYYSESDDGWVCG